MQRFLKTRYVTFITLLTAVLLSYSQISTTQAARSLQEPQSSDSAQATAIPDADIFILTANERGRTCRTATPAEAAYIKRADFSLARYVDQPRFQTNQTTGLKIILRGTAAFESNPTAKAAFQKAAAVWEARIKTPVTVLIDVDFGSTFFGQPYGSPNVIGATGAPTTSIAYERVRAALIATSSTAAERTMMNALPTGSVPTDVNPGTTTTVRIPNSVQRALGLLPPVATQSDAVMGFNSAFPFDFDPSNGIDRDKIDFDATVVHELGHALGFLSDAGETERIPGRPATVSVWDIFRFRPGTTLSNFSTAKRILSTGDPQRFLTQDIRELGLSTGRVDGVGGDGEQSSHWKANEKSGTYIGIMDPTGDFGDRDEITANDLTAMDSFGYTLTSTQSDDTTPPTVTVTAPKGGESLTGASNTQITWTSSDTNGVLRHDILLSTDSGATFPTTITSGVAGTAQSFTWSVPLDVTTTTARIRVAAFDGAFNVGNGTSAGDFAIKLPQIAPPQNLTASLNGAFVRLSWTAPPPIPTAFLKNYNIYRTRTSPVELSAGNRLGTFDISITTFSDRPSPQDGKPFFYAVTAVYDTGESPASNEAMATPGGNSDTVAPTVRVLTPNGGETVASGDKLNITWTSTDNVGVASQSIDLSTDNGGSFGTAVTAGLAGNVQAFTFDLPATLTTNAARIRVTARDAAGNNGQDASDASFTIKSNDTEKPTVTVTSPGASTAKLTGGAAFTVTWTSRDNVGIASHQILLSKDDGATFPTTLAASVAGTAQSFSVTIPNEKIKKGKIKVTANDAAGNTGEGVSTTFKVKQK
ncbi:MAG: NF038122 family metalloprotease [Blastocatellia bacterium]|nr:NF038122 family metalloprotease [Blastocatellia bacterium]